jgi:ribosomal protection tetracycline resistance protein
MSDCASTKTQPRSSLSAGVARVKPTRRLGCVDAGTTQTDSDEVERRRGITIRAAVASFTYGSSRVNLIDTPGHAEFIAEVERALGVLDGAVLVVSAVEGVQAQTRILMRTLRALSMPTLIFVNKIDRMGARADELLSDLREALAVRVVPLNRARNLGTSEAQVHPVLSDPAGAAAVADGRAGEDDELLEQLVAGEDPSPGLLWPALARQVRSGDLQPVIF